VDAFDTGCLYRDLWLSPDHAVYIGDVPIPVEHLINGKTITRILMHTLAPYHLALPHPAVLLAEANAAAVRFA
jgi:hypothetical protein